ncbi:sterol transporter [Martiniozyma asiatica (nom. inval.)]|nr:sterol transporter [Martiniozyma asiatica]
MVGLYKLIAFASFSHALSIPFSIFGSLNVDKVIDLDIDNAMGFPVPGTKPIPGGSPLSICDATNSQLLNLKSVVLDPNPPERGQNLTITASGILDETIDDGAYVDVVVTYGYIKLLQQTYDLCEELPNVEMECPVEKGDYQLTKEVAIPKEVPPGKYVVTARAYTKDDELITCLTGTVEFPTA